MANPPITHSDVGWVALFMALLLSLSFGGMFFGAAYVTPAVLGSPNSMPRHGIGAFVEIAILFCGMLFGMVAALGIFGFLTRRFLSRESYQRWALQFENGASKLPRFQVQLGRHIIKHMRPRN